MVIKKAKPTQTADHSFYGYFKNNLHKEAFKLKQDSLSNLLSTLSNHITTTVLAEQITRVSGHGLNETLRLASELSMLSATINEQLKPAQHIKKTSNLHNKNNLL